MNKHYLWILAIFVIIYFIWTIVTAEIKIRKIKRDQDD